MEKVELMRKNMIKTIIFFSLALSLCSLLGFRWLWGENKELKKVLSNYFNAAIHNGSTVIDLRKIPGQEIIKACFQNEYMSSSYMEKLLGRSILRAPDLTNINYAFWVKYKDGDIAYATFYQSNPFKVEEGTVCTKEGDPRLYIRRDSKFTYLSFGVEEK